MTKCWEVTGCDELMSNPRGVAVLQVILYLRTRWHVLRNNETETAEYYLVHWIIFQTNSFTGKA